MLDLLIPVFKILLMLTVIWTVLSYFLTPKRTFEIVHSRWHHLFAEMQLSPRDFYADVMEEIQSRKIPHIELSEVTHSEGGILSSSRLYLQIKRGDHLILVCAAPFGSEYFVSWWFGDVQNSLNDFIRGIPYIGKHLGEQMDKRTFYQLDTNDMFKDIIKHCVLEVIDRMANEKGFRPLSDHQRIPTDRAVALKMV